MALTALSLERVCMCAVCTAARSITQDVYIGMSIYIFIYVHMYCLPFVAAALRRIRLHGHVSKRACALLSLRHILAFYNTNAIELAVTLY